MKKTHDTPSLVIAMVLAMLVEFITLCNAPNLTQVVFGWPRIIMCGTAAAYDQTDSYP